VRIAARPRAKQNHALDPLAVHFIKRGSELFKDRIIERAGNHAGQNITNGAAARGIRSAATAVCL
jgi:hypothetical protein